MVATIKEHVEELWWLIVLQGLATIIFGLVALLAPGLTLAAFVIVVAVYSIILGMIDLVHGFGSIGKNGSWIFSIILGLLLMGIGVYLVRNPIITLGVFILIVGTILFVRGVVDVIAAAFFSSKYDQPWLTALMGIISVVAGIYIWSNPAAGGLAFVWALGLYALVTGSMTIAHALHMKGMFNELKETIEGAASKHDRRVAHGHK